MDEMMPLEMSYNHCFQNNDIHVQKDDIEKWLHLGQFGLFGKILLPLRFNMMSQYLFHSVTFVYFQF